jgi:carbon-monoxide dehydrogenase large subunit
VNKPMGPLAGQRIRRKEDLRFITGEGRYLDDRKLPDMAHALVLRSPHAHARIKSIRTRRAAVLPGVLAIYTGADLDAAKVGTLPVGWIVPATNGKPMARPPHPVLATECVRHVGDPVAFIVAETRDDALAAMRKIDVDYETLKPAVDLASSLDGQAAEIWPQEAPGNLCYDWDVGDEAAVAEAFASAHHVTTVNPDQQSRPCLAHGDAGRCRPV